MKRLIFLFITVLIIEADTDAQSKLLKKYYYWVNKAELAICDSNYQEASDCYDKAFSFHRPFAKDASFAFKVNYQYLNNAERCLDCFKYLAQMGDEVDWYVNDTLKNVGLLKQMKRMSDTTKCLLNPGLATALLEISRSDQAVRWQQYEDQATAFAAFRKMDSINLIKIKEIYKTYPEISDYTAGTSPILCAFYTHVSKAFLFDPKTILLKDVRKGILSANQYAFYEDEWKCMYIDVQLGDSNNTIYGTNAYFIFMIDSLAFFLEPNNVKKINKERKRIGLSETWGDFIKKAKYVYTHDTEFHFIPRSNLWYLPEEAAAEIEERVKAINNGECKGSYFVVPKELR